MQYCPECKSNNLTLNMGFLVGHYKGKKCGYSGPLSIEKDIKTKKSKKK